MLIVDEGPAKALAEEEEVRELREVGVGGVGDIDANAQEVLRSDDGEAGELPAGMLAVEGEKLFGGIATLIADTSRMSYSL